MELRVDKQHANKPDSSEAYELAYFRSQGVRYLSSNLLSPPSNDYGNAGRTGGRDRVLCKPVPHLPHRHPPGQEAVLLCPRAHGRGAVRAQRRVLTGLLLSGRVQRGDAGLAGRAADRHCGTGPLPSQRYFFPVESTPNFFAL